MHEKITLWEYTTQNFIFCILLGFTFLSELLHFVRLKYLKCSTIMERPIQLLLDFQASKVLNSSSLHRSENGWNNYTLWAYYSNFHVLDIRQVYISTKLFSYCSTKITKVLNNDGASYAIIVRFPTIQSAHW